MSELVRDFIRRYWWVLTLSILWGVFAVSSPLDGYLRMVLFSFSAWGMGLPILIDRNHYMRVTLSLPIRRRDVAGAFWVEGVLVVPIMFLGCCLVVALLLPDSVRVHPLNLKILVFQFEFLTVWCAFLWAARIPIEPNADGDLLTESVKGLLMGGAFFLPFFVPQAVWQALADSAWLTAVPVVVAVYALTYLSAPHLYLPCASAGHPGSYAGVVKPASPSIQFTDRWITVLQTLVFPFAWIPVLMGFSMVVSFSVLWFYQGKLMFDFLQHLTGEPIIIATACYSLPMIASTLSASSRVYRAVPVSANGLALAMTLLTAGSVVGYFLPFFLLQLIAGTGQIDLAAIPNLLFYAGFFVFFFAVAFRYCKVGAYYLVAAPLLFLLALAINSIRLPFSSTIYVLLTAGLVILGFLINRDTIAHAGGIYRRKVNLALGLSQPR